MKTIAFSSRSGAKRTCPTRADGREADDAAPAAGAVAAISPQDLSAANASRPKISGRVLGRRGTGCQTVRTHGWFGKSNGEFRYVLRCRIAANLALLIVVSAILCGCGGSGSSPQTGGTAVSEKENGKLDKVVLQLNWFPEAEHGGFYAALVHGYYEKHGIDVTIQPGGPGIPVTTQVAAGQVQFGVSIAHKVLLARAQEANTVAVMAPLQHSPRCIIVHEKSGIRSFDDLQNVTLAMNDSSTFSLYLKKKVPLTGCKIVPYNGNVAQFLIDESFAQQGYVFSEPYVAREKGGDPHSLMVSDLGFDPYTSILITHPEIIRKQPDLVRRMVAASVEGWRHYLTDAAKTNAYIHQLNQDMDLGILDFGVQELQRLCIEENAEPLRIGQMTIERWQELTDQLVEVDALEPGRVDPSDAFSNMFLDDLTSDQ